MEEQINTSQENNEQTYFVPDAKEQIDAALKARSFKPRNRAERRALMKKMGKNNYNVIADTAAKLDYIDLIQKLRALNEKKRNEVIDDEQTTED